MTSRLLTSSGTHLRNFLSACALSSLADALPFLAQIPLILRFPKMCNHLPIKNKYVLLVFQCLAMIFISIDTFNNLPDSARKTNYIEFVLSDAKRFLLLGFIFLLFTSIKFIFAWIDSSCKTEESTKCRRDLSIGYAGLVACGIAVHVLMVKQRQSEVMFFLFTKSNK